MIRAIYFDAVGTLIHPEPDAARIYAEVGARHGSTYTRAEIVRRFRAAFQHQEEIDREAGWKTSQIREWRRWRDIVGEVLDDVRNANVCFAELYMHFAKASSWRIEPDVEPLLLELQSRGYRLGMASNYDHRLREVVAELPQLHCLYPLAISSEVGWRKPAGEFFTALCRQAGALAHEILFVGDDRFNDYDAARAAGLHAVLLDGSGKRPARGQESLIASLGELGEAIARLADRPGSSNRG